MVCCNTKGQLTVNGVAITEPYIYPGNAPSEKDFDITVPAGKIWVMGDHREISRDSRFNDPGGTGKDGSVPIDLVVGRAVADRLAAGARRLARRCRTRPSRKVPAATAGK